MCSLSGRFHLQRFGWIYLDARTHRGSQRYVADEQALAAAGRARPSCSSQRMLPINCSSEKRLANGAVDVTTAVEAILGDRPWPHRQHVPHRLQGRRYPSWAWASSHGDPGHDQGDFNVAHHIRDGDGDVKVGPAAEDLLDALIVALMM